jgi:hypothetical protein
MRMFLALAPCNFSAATADSGLVKSPSPSLQCQHDHLFHSATFSCRLSDQLHWPRFGGSCLSGYEYDVDGVHHMLSLTLATAIRPNQTPISPSQYYVLRIKGQSHIPSDL